MQSIVGIVCIKLNVDIRKMNNIQTIVFSMVFLILCLIGFVTLVIGLSNKINKLMKVKTPLELDKKQQRYFFKLVSGLDPIQKIGLLQILIGSKFNMFIKVNDDHITFEGLNKEYDIEDDKEKLKDYTG